ncbi:MAG: acyl-CoA/acyl-ACP dehydrogenase [Chromatiales bacterium]|nr:acyl-CoA/acyl-ACP dehydrogenase [Chromatiales bacterium]
MSESDSLVMHTTARLFEDLGDPQTINADAEGNWRAPLWDALEDTGLTRTWVPETLGGAGADIVDGFDVLRVSGQFAVAVPLAETLLAGWMLTQAGIEIPASGKMTTTAGPGLHMDGELVQGDAGQVPFGREADYIVAVTTDADGARQAALLESAQCTVRAGESLSREPRDSVSFRGARPIAHAPLPAGWRSDLDAIGALVRAVQMAGALRGVLDMCVQYASERVAFERPIAKFQAVQHNLARLAGEFAAANAAANSAAYALANEATGEQSLFVEIAAAKVRAGQAAHEGGMIAHQVHGAIGFTMEHILHRYTHRLWSWRDDFGDENAWALKLGTHFAAAGADDMWPTLTAI